MAEANLTDAALDAYVNLAPLYRAGTMKAKLLAFANAVLASFPDSGPNNHPVGNWCSLIAALSTNLPATILAQTPADLTNAAQYVYRICLVTKYLNDNNLITNTQGAAVLTAYNAQFT